MILTVNLASLAASRMSTTSTNGQKHTNETTSVAPPKTNPDTGRLDRNDARRYLAEIALREFQAIEKRDRKTRTDRTSLNDLKEMQRLMDKGNYKEAIRYANEKGIGREKGSIADTKETNGERVIQRGQNDLLSVDAAENLTNQQIHELNILVAEFETALISTGSGIQPPKKLVTTLRAGLAFAKFHGVKEQYVQCVQSYLQGLTPDEVTIINKALKNSRRTKGTPISPAKAARNGITGHVRNKNELSTRQVISVTDGQLLRFSSKDLKKIINSYPPEMRSHVLMALRRMTQFGNIQSIEQLNNKLIESLGKNYLIYTDKGPSLASNLKYLNKKDALTNESPVWVLENFESIFDIRKGTNPIHSRKPVLLMDEYTLGRLEASPRFASKLQKSGVEIILPEGWDTGISFANQGKNLERRLANLVERAQEIQTTTGLDCDTAFTKALNEPIIQRLTQLGFDENKIHTLRLVQDFSDSDINNILNQLNPIRMSSGQLKEMLKQTFPDKHKHLRKYARELIAQDSRIYSPRRMSILLRRQHLKILELADEKEIPHENIIYFLRDKGSSYGLVTMMYCSTNGIPAKQVITENITKQRKIKGKKMIVVLDDISSSGTQPCSTYKIIRVTNDIDCDVVITSLLGSNGKQNSAVNRFASLRAEDPKLHFIPFHTTPGFKNSSYFQSLSQEDKEFFALLMQDDGFTLNGFGGNGLCSVFPHMAGTSNNAFWNDMIAPLFLRSPASVKVNAKWIPMTNLTELKEIK